MITYHGRPTTHIRELHKPQSALQLYSIILSAMNNKLIETK